jgi:hypothetical protein
MGKRNGKNGDGNGGSAPGVPFEEGNPFRFKPGQSGNPAGLRPLASKLSKYRAIKPRLDEKLLDYWDAPCDVKPFVGLGMTWGEVWVRALYVNGIRGRPTAIRELHERIWGKVALPIKLTTTVELGDEARMAQAMTDEELAEWEALTAATAERERALLDVVRQRLGEAPVDVPSTPVEPKT